MWSCFQSKQRKVDKIREEEDRQKRIAEREKKQEEEARKRRQVRLDDVTLKYNVFSSQFFSYLCERCCRSESACARSVVAIAVAVELRRRDDDNTLHLHSIEPIIAVDARTCCVRHVSASATNLGRHCYHVVAAVTYATPHHT